MSEFSLVAPKLVLEFYDACLAGEQRNERMLRIYEKILDCSYAVPGGLEGGSFSSYEIAYLNATAEIGGHKAGPPRHPYQALPREMRTRLEIAAHPLQAVLDDDVAGAVGRFIEGTEISDETLATDLINEVGPIPGHYLSTAHTRKWWKIVQFIPKVADSLTYPEWEKTGKKSCIDYAKLRLEEILKTHRPSKLLTENQEDALRQILEEAREYYKKKGVI